MTGQSTRSPEAVPVAVLDDALLAYSDAKRAMIETIVGEGLPKSRSGGSAALSGARTVLLGNAW
jgi:hypothetical protein